MRTIGSMKLTWRQALAWRMRRHELAPMGRLPPASALAAEAERLGSILGRDLVLAITAAR